jgi:hypothetical protein
VQSVYAKPEKDKLAIDATKELELKERRLGSFFDQYYKEKYFAKYGEKETIENSNKTLCTADKTKFAQTFHKLAKSGDITWGDLTREAKQFAFAIFTFIVESNAKLREAFSADEWGKLKVKLSIA